MIGLDGLSLLALAACTIAALWIALEPKGRR